MNQFLKSDKNIKCWLTWEYLFKIGLTEDDAELKRK